LTQIERGDYTFAELAKRYSDCNSAGKGGELAPFKEGAMQPAFEKAVYEEDGYSLESHRELIFLVLMF
jgi:parvulin-like peptidyl-prolyl isomerase